VAKKNKKAVGTVEAAHGFKKSIDINPAGLRADFTSLILPPPPAPECQLLFAHETFF
jgi:hypothetical protein